MTDMESESPMIVPELMDEQDVGSSVQDVEGQNSTMPNEDEGSEENENVTSGGDGTPNPPTSTEAATNGDSEATEDADKSTKNPKIFRRNSSSFLRVSDLDLPPPSGGNSSTNEIPDGESADNDEQDKDYDEEDQLSHFHHPSADPPPGMEKDDREKFIAIGSHDGVVAPIAPLAIEKLGSFGLETALNETMWTPDRKTKRLIERATLEQDWIPHTFASTAFSVGDSCNFYEKDVFVWSGTFSHDFYGCDLPAIRVSGTVNMSAEDLIHLLLDSSRVKEYNRLMVGRTDVQVFANDLYNESSDNESNPFGPCVVKFTRATTKPPLVNRLMIFNNLCYAKKLPDDVGYLVCNRAIFNAKQTEEEPTNIIKSEVLLGVNLIRHLKDKETGEIVPNKCVMTNVNHMRSPKIPMMIAKKVGTNAAIGFLNDFRRAAEQLATSKG